MGKTALLVVDVQTALMDNHPYLEEHFTRVLQTLLPACRERGAEVIYVRHDDGPGSTLSPGTPGYEIYAPLAPAPGEQIFDKKRNSAFLDTGLEQYLRKRDIGTVILVGMQTELCIDATCKAALEHGFQVVIPRGATTSFGNLFMSGKDLCAFYEEHIWQGRFARVLPPAEVLSLL